MPVPAGIFKAYDVRGLYGSEMDGDTAYLLGRGFARVLARLRGKEPGELRVGLGRDMRLEAPEMSRRLREGLVAEGCDVLDAGMVGTEMLYHLVGSRELDGGAMVTASHNPKAYTGVKLVREGALALSGDAGIQDIRREIEAGLGEAPGGGSVEAVDVYDDFHARALGFIDPSSVRPLKVVVDGGNGMAGPMAGPLLDRPRPRPRHHLLGPRRRVPRPRAEPAAGGEPRLHRRAREGRGSRSRDRVGRRRRPLLLHRRPGEFVDGDFLTALLARGVLAREPGATVLYDVRASRAVPDTVAELGGRSHMCRVGHAFMKIAMREHDAAFAGEVSGHYYFRDFWCADSGTIPALLVLELVSAAGRPFSELVSELRSRYFISGEINSEVADQEAKMREIAARHPDAEVSWLDGVSIDYPDWHFNVRPSNTEPLLRLNLESLVSREDMEARRDEVLGLIRS